MLRWLVNTIGEQAPTVAVMTLISTLMGGYLGYTIVREFGVEDEPNQPSEVQRDRR